MFSLLLLSQPSVYIFHIFFSAASFAENFYGLKRVSVVNDKPVLGESKLPSSNVVRSLAYLVSKQMTVTNIGFLMF